MAIDSFKVAKFTVFKQVIVWTLPEITILKAATFTSRSNPNCENIEISKSGVNIKIISMCVKVWFNTRVC